MLNPSILSERLWASQPHTPRPKMRLFMLGDAQHMWEAPPPSSKHAKLVLGRQKKKWGKWKLTKKVNNVMLFDKATPTSCSTPPSYLSASGRAYLQKRKTWMEIMVVTGRGNLIRSRAT